MQGLCVTDDLAEGLVEPGIIFVPIRCDHVDGRIIGAIGSAGKFITAFGVYVNIGITEMTSECAVGRFEEQPDGFPGFIIQVDTDRRPVLAPNGCGIGEGRYKKARQGGTVWKESERRATDQFAVGYVHDLQFQSWLLKGLVVGILENDRVVIDQRVSISVRRYCEFIGKSFSLRTANGVTQFDGIITSIGADYRESAVRVRESTGGGP